MDQLIELSTADLSEVSGGWALSLAFSSADASGKHGAATYTNTETEAKSFHHYSSAESESASASFAV